MLYYIDTYYQTGAAMQFAGGCGSPQSGGGELERLYIPQSDSSCYLVSIFSLLYCYIDLVFSI